MAPCTLNQEKVHWFNFGFAIHFQAYMEAFPSVCNTLYDMTQINSSYNIKTITALYLNLLNSQHIEANFLLNGILFKYLWLGLNK